MSSKKRVRDIILLRMSLRQTNDICERPPLLQSTSKRTLDHAIDIEGFHTNIQSSYFSTNQFSVLSRCSSMIQPNAIPSYLEGALVTSRRVNRAQYCIRMAEGAGIWKKDKGGIALSNDEKTGINYR